MRFIGIDYGEKWIGVAYSTGTFAQPLTQYPRRDALVQLDLLCRKLHIECIIVGLPEGAIASKVRQFGKQLTETLKLPVILWDESLSSVQANVQLMGTGAGRKKRDKKNHQYAAAIILGSYIENKKNHDTG